MNSTRIASESFGAAMEETIARVQGTRQATADRNRSYFYMATILTASIIAVGVMLTFAAL